MVTVRFNVRLVSGYALMDDTVKYYVPTASPTILFPSPPHPTIIVPIPTQLTLHIVPIRIPACMSVFCYNFCNPPDSQSLLLVLHIIFSSLSILCAVFLFRDKGTVIKHLFNRETVVLRLHTCLQSKEYYLFFECHYRKTS